MLRSRVVPLVVALAFLMGLFSPYRPVLDLNAQADSRYFPETKHYVKGLFLKYWNEHGGLAQQGYPLTEEFTEPSKQDPGKSYTVQYFERAVFERHPENAGTPFEVLLTQLGKYELDSRYPNSSNPAAAPQPPPSGPPLATATVPPAPPAGSVQFSGSGTQVTPAFALHKGLALFHSTQTGGTSNFIVELVDNTGAPVGFLANAVGAADVSAAVAVPAAGQYSLKVTADGQWTISGAQPTATYSAPPATQTFSGHGSQVTALFSLKAGAARFHAVSTNGTGNFIAELLDTQGAPVDFIANEIGASDSSTITNISANGVFLLNVTFDGDWTITIQQ